MSYCSAAGTTAQRVAKRADQIARGNCRDRVAGTRQATGDRGNTGGKPMSTRNEDWDFPISRSFFPDDVWFRGELRKYRDRVREANERRLDLMSWGLFCATMRSTST